MEAKFDKFRCCCCKRKKKTTEEEEEEEEVDPEGWFDTVNWTFHHDPDDPKGLKI